MIYPKLKTGQPVRRIGQPDRGMGVIEAEDEDLSDMYYVRWPSSNQSPKPWTNQVHISALRIIE